MSRQETVDIVDIHWSCLSQERPAPARGVKFPKIRPQKLMTLTKRIILSLIGHVRLVRVDHFFCSTAIRIFPMRTALRSNATDGFLLNVQMSYNKFNTPSINTIKIGAHAFSSTCVDRKVH